MDHNTKRKETGIQSSYTWKNEYLLPFESFWGRIAKFCFLNCVPWTYIDSSLKKYFYTKLSNDEMLYIYLPKFNGKRYKVSDDINRNYKVYRYCPECMKYGYHSILHEIDGFDCCFLHQCELTPITKKEWDDSRNGTYSFFDVQAKNIIYNKPIYDDIIKYIEKRNAEGIISSSHFFINSTIKDSNSYESTERLYQRLFLLQDSVELYGCQCISSVQIDNIFETNKCIFEDIMYYYTQNIMEKNDYWSSIEKKDFAKIYTYCKNIFLQPNHQNQYLLTDDTLAWCFIAVVSKKVRLIFNNLDDWYDTIQSFKNKKIFYKKSVDNINKFLIILAYATITGSFNPNNIFQYDSKNWINLFSSFDFRIPVEEIMGYWGKSYDLKNIGPSRATQYIIYPIINDLFSDLMTQIKNLLKQGVIDSTYEFIFKLNTDIWDIPQYVVFYYKDRVDIYRCKPEIEENIYNI